MTHDIFQKKKKKIRAIFFGFFGIGAHVGRFSVSRVQDFFLPLEEEKNRTGKRRRRKKEEIFPKVSCPYFVIYLTR